MKIGIFAPLANPIATPEYLETLAKGAEERGRKRSDVQVSICPYLRGLQDGDIDGYEAAGVDQVIVMAFAMTPDALTETLDSLAAAVGLDS